MQRRGASRVPPSGAGGAARPGPWRVLSTMHARRPAPLLRPIPARVGTRHAPYALVLVPTQPLLEIVVRVCVIYAALLVMVRVAGKREVGQLSALDLLAMLVLSETVSPALTAQDTSLTAALVAAGTLLAATALTSRLTFHSRRAERWIEGAPAVLVKDGRIVEKTARRERVTRQELETALRNHGVEDLAEVRRAVVEPSGEITVVTVGDEAK